MELPQPRPFGAGGKKPTHDFLTLYGDASFHHQDPRPSSHEFYLKTHDFLQPLERVGKSSSSREDASETISSVEKPSSIEHVLPGGIGTYSISCIRNISSFSSAVKAERAPFPDVRAASAERSSSDASKANGSNCNSFGKGAFTLWDESVVRDKVGEGHPAREAIERKAAPFLPFDSLTGFGAQPSSKQTQGQQKSMGFLEMMKSVKGPPQKEDDDDDDYVKKEVPGQKGEVGVKADAKGNDQKANTPRSKHSATEQRRRSKINDRFQILRELIPHSDQKRDKASFLLEVIEYIHFLQEKVQKYEAAFPGWNQGGMKFVPWKSNHGLGETVADPSRGIKTGAGPGLMFAGKLEENGGSSAPAMLGNPQNPVESDNISPGTPYKTMDHHPGLASKTIPVLSPSQQTTYTSIARSSGNVQTTQRWGSDSENRASRTQQQFGQRPSPVDSDNMSEQEEPAVEGGTIRVSSVYSQGLLNSLTQALQSSGVDLSQASITVQIDLGKRAVSRPSTTTSSKDHEDPSSSNRIVANSRAASSVEDSHQQAQKRPRTS